MYEDINIWTVIGFMWGPIVISILIGIKLYSSKKARELRQLGFEYLYYYMVNCGLLTEYYRNKESHIYNIYQASYEKLKLCKNKWWLSSFSKDTVNKLISFYEKAASLTKDISPFFDEDHYFAFSECKPFIERANELEKLMKSTVTRECKEYIFETKQDRKFVKFPNEVQYLHNFKILRDVQNNMFVQKELTENKEYFDTILKYPLDPQQRESIVQLEDNCLVISSAGSGKTSTSIAKVRYLLDKRNLSPEEILVLSYNRKTAAEFKERLNVQEVACRTFHRFACDIIAEVEGKFPDVAEAELLLQSYYQLIKKDDKFKAAVTKYVGEVSDLTKLEHYYKKAEDYFKDRETYGIMAPYGDMYGNPIYTRSQEEKKICTWLSTHGVDFLYEQPYPIDTSTKYRKQYKPDFTIYFKLNGQLYYIFLEHFGIDKDGNVPEWFGEGKERGYDEANREYKSGIEWKRSIHREFNTQLIETTSAMFHDGTIYQKLEQELRKCGINPVELTEEEKYQKLFERNKTMEENIMNLFSSFISLMKSNGKSFDSIMKDIEESGEPQDFCERCRFLMYQVIKPLYDEYEKTLSEKKQRDFTDIILCAANYCETGQYQPRFSYILVDEFQDISVDRYKFIKSLRRQNPLTKTYCVGDDWQSIYRFSGSDMNLFNQFEKYFGFTVRCKIEKTYRFGNPLVEQSSKFILKNPSQVQKLVMPVSDQVCTQLSFVPFVRGNDNSSYIKAIENIINKIPADESVMLLARYNYEVKVFPNKYVKQQSPTSKRAVVDYAGRTMQFMSVHAAKGLEADNVIILNCSQDGGGFPSRITDDPILGFVLSEIDKFEYSEERRLFYVAITRARKHTFVMYNLLMPSVFVAEMIKDKEENIMICPVCKKGFFKVVKEMITSNGRHFRFYLCSNSIAGCQHYWKVFYDNEEEIFPQYQKMIQNIEAAKVADEIRRQILSTMTVPSRENNFFS